MSLTPALTPAALVLLLLATSATAADAVVEERPAHRSAVGRKIYTVPRDLADSGSVTDMLRGLPFVEIDADGEVSLRGDANVTILIDAGPQLSFPPDGAPLPCSGCPPVRSSPSRS